MSFEIFTGDAIEKELDEMFSVLDDSNYAVSDLPSQLIRRYAKSKGRKVQINWHETGKVKIRLVSTQQEAKGKQ